MVIPPLESQSYHYLPLRQQTKLQTKSHVSGPFKWQLVCIWRIAKVPFITSYGLNVIEDTSKKLDQVSEKKSKIGDAEKKTVLGCSKSIFFTHLCSGICTDI